MQHSNIYLINVNDWITFLPYCLTLDKGTVVGYLIDRLDQMQNLEDKRLLSEIYNTWKLTRDNPNCSVEAGLLLCP